MASIVSAFGVPHTPFIRAWVKRDGPNSETALLFADITRHLAESQPDVIVLFDTDHLNTFFFDNLPIFALGVTDSFLGPIDDVPTLPPFVTPSLPLLAAHLHRAAVEAGFDLALTQKFDVDHSVGVPLFFMNPKRDIPVIPIFISGHVPPLPSARRCYALGQTIAAAIAAWHQPLRVAVVGSGSFSLEVWGPKMAPGRSDGVPDPHWMARVQTLLEDGRTEALLDETTPAQIRKAGNVAGEILNWIALLGTVDGRRASYVAPQADRGHAFAAWNGS